MAVSSRDGLPIGNTLGCTNCNSTPANYAKPIKTNGYLGFIIWIVFVLAVVGLVVNLTKQGTLYLELEEIKNGKS